MTTDDYTTTTGERWVINKAGVPYEPGGSPVRITRAAVTAELRALRAIIDKHDLCHNQHGKVDARAFADGCTAEQRKHYGCAPDADEVVALRAQRDELLAALKHLYNCSGSEEAYEQARTTLERVARREEAKGEA